MTTQQLVRAMRAAHVMHERARVDAVLDARVMRGDPPTLTYRCREEVRIAHVCSYSHAVCGVGPVPGPLGPPEAPRPGEPTTVGGKRKGPNT